MTGPTGSTCNLGLPRERTGSVDEWPMAKPKQSNGRQPFAVGAVMVLAAIASSSWGPQATRPLVGAVRWKEALGNLEEESGLPTRRWRHCRGR